jgi:cation-transporting ATPase 13A3/4/5
MDMWGVLPVQEHRFQLAVKDMRQLGRIPLQLGMASCHSLTLINGALSGDPLDVKVRCCLRLLNGGSPRWPGSI